MLSTLEYFLPFVTWFGSLTFTTNVDASMFGLSIINLWSCDVSTENVLVKYVPSYIVISSSNCAKELVPIAFTALEVIVSGIENL